MPTQFYINPWRSDQTYKKYDITYGLDIGGTVYQSPYFYATQDIPAGYSPSGAYTYSVSAYSRTDDVVTLTYTHSGGLPFALGSQVTIAGVTAAPSVHYTGMITVGGSGTISYICPGYNGSASLAAGTITCYCPAWSTGYFFVPDYTTKVTTQNQAIETKLGNGYSQRMSNGLNSFNQTPSLVYRNIDKRQTKALLNFVEDTAGVRGFPIVMNDQFLSNQPNHKYTAQSAEPTPVSFERYDVTVGITRVFDP